MAKLFGLFLPSPRYLVDLPNALPSPAGFPVNPQVPEEMQLNVLKKQREMVLLEDSLHTMRSRFNSRFLALRTIKREILSTVAADNRRLREIDAELGEGGNGGECWRRVYAHFLTVYLVEACCLSKTLLYC